MAIAASDIYASDIIYCVICNVKISVSFVLLRRYSRLFTFSLVIFRSIHFYTWHILKLCYYSEEVCFMYFVLAIPSWLTNSFLDLHYVPCVNGIQLRSLMGSLPLKIKAVELNNPQPII